MQKQKREQEIKRQKYYYECYIDKKSFISEKEYVKHFREYHNDDYPFYCEECCKGFFSYQSIKAHNGAKHKYNY